MHPSLRARVSSRLPARSSGRRAVAEPTPPPQDPKKRPAGEEQQPPPAGEPVDVAQESPVYKEQVVVSASKNEEALVNAPAAVSIITSQTIVNTARRATPICSAPFRA